MAGDPSDRSDTTDLPCGTTGFKPCTATNPSSIGVSIVSIRDAEITFMRETMVKNLDSRVILVDTATPEFGTLAIVVRA